MIRQVSLTLSLWFTLQTTHQYDTSMQQLEPTLTTRAVKAVPGILVQIFSGAIRLIALLKNILCFTFLCF